VVVGSSVQDVVGFIDVVEVSVHEVESVHVVVGSVHEVESVQVVVAKV
jgi:hypothetical protein